MKIVATAKTLAWKLAKLAYLHAINNWLWCVVCAIVDFVCAVKWTRRKKGYARFQIHVWEVLTHKFTLALYLPATVGWVGKCNSLLARRLMSSLTFWKTLIRVQASYRYTIRFENRNMHLSLCFMKGDWIKTSLRYKTSSTTKSGANNLLVVL